MIEAQTYRFGGHSSSDDPKRYRSEEEFASWTARDPLARVEVFLRTSVVDDSYFAELELEADELAASTREACKQLTGQTLAEMFGNVYAEPHPLIERERTANAEFIALVGGGL